MCVGVFFTQLETSKNRFLLPRLPCLLLSKPPLLSALSRRGRARYVSIVQLFSENSSYKMSLPVGAIEEQYMTVTGAGPAPVNIAEFERYAKSVLPRNAFGYYSSGSNDMITLRENRDAYARLRLMPKILVDVSVVDTETTILGEKIAFPICFAPSAMQKMAHPDGECATIRAAARYLQMKF